MTNNDTRQQNWNELQQALKELTEEVKFLVVCPTKEQIQCMDDTYTTLHYYALRFVKEQQE